MKSTTKVALALRAASEALQCLDDRIASDDVPGPYELHAPSFWMLHASLHRALEGDSWRCESSGVSRVGAGLEGSCDVVTPLAR